MGRWVLGSGGDMQATIDTEIELFNRQLLSYIKMISSLKNVGEILILENFQKL